MDRAVPDVSSLKADLNFPRKFPWECPAGKSWESEAGLISYVTWDSSLDVQYIQVPSLLLTS